MPHTYGQNSAFNANKASRDTHCRNKDTVLVDMLKPFITSRNPKTFTALLMPALYGVEAFLCTEHRVPMRNVFAIEENKEIHDEIIHCTRPDRQQFKGMLTTPAPMSVEEAIHYACVAQETGYDLIYLDFFGYPYKKHLEMLRVVFRCAMLKPNSLLMLNFSRNRSHRPIKQFNDGIVKTFKSLSGDATLTENELATGILVYAAIDETKHALPEKMWFGTYASNINCGQKYTTMFAEFNRRKHESK